jgi:hypothetical protein
VASREGRGGEDDIGATSCARAPLFDRSIDQDRARKAVRRRGRAQ